MHICHIITRLIIGGAQENTVLTCRGLVERGHRVTLIAGPETGPEGSLWGEAERTGCELARLDAMRRAVNPIQDWRARKRLTAVLRELRPDIVHTHSSKAGILGRSAAARAGVAVIVHTIHGMSFNRTQPFPIRRIYQMLERRTARHTTALVSVADAMTEQAVAAGLAPRDRFVTIRSGMETERYRPDAAARERVRRRWGAADGDVVIGTVARLFINKGYEEIIAAMPVIVAQCPKARFVWIGNGPNRAAYERRAASLGLRDRVILTGLIDPSEVAEQLNGFDILLHASQWEGLPRAVAQAMLCGVPAVSFDNDGAPEVVIPCPPTGASGGTGVLVPFGHVAGLTEGVVTLARDGDLRRRLGRAGRDRCLAMFDWRIMVDQLDALYVKLLASRRA